MWCTRSSLIPRFSPSSWWAQHWSKKKYVDRFILIHETHRVHVLEFIFGRFPVRNGQIWVLDIFPPIRPVQNIGVISLGVSMPTGSTGLIKRWDSETCSGFHSLPTNLTRLSVHLQQHVVNEAHCRQRWILWIFAGCATDLSNPDETINPLMCNCKPTAVEEKPRVTLTEAFSPKCIPERFKTFAFWTLKLHLPKTHWLWVKIETELSPVNTGLFQRHSLPVFQY